MPNLVSFYNNVSMTDDNDVEVVSQIDNLSTEQVKNYVDFYNRIKLDINGAIKIVKR